MAYNLNPAQNILAIAEQQFGSSADQIQTTGLDSCICVIGRTAARQAVGIHLVIIAVDGTQFDGTAAKLVQQTLITQGVIQNGNNLPIVAIVGDIGAWLHSESQLLSEAYQTLLGLVDTGDGARIKDAQGIYSAQMNDNGTVDVSTAGAVVLNF